MVTVSRSDPRRRPALIAGICVLTALLAGCTSAAQTPAGGTTTQASAATSTTSPAPTSPAPTSPAPTSPATTGTPTTKTSQVASAVTATVTTVRPGKTITVGAPQPTREPPAVAGDCPYLNADVVSFITGQHHGQTQLVKLAPQPMCVFYRADGGWMGSVRVIKAASPQAAVAAVNQHVPIAKSQPASQPAGWTGGSMTTPGQMTQDSTGRSVYAVSKGDIAIVAEQNENLSIKPRLMAVCAIYGLKLETGQAPSACSGAEG